MLLRFFFIFLISVVVSACCNKEPYEEARIALSDKEMALISYEFDDSIKFKHSEGFEFTFKTTSNNIIWYEERDFCEVGCCGKPYFSFQTKTTVIESSYPNLRIEFSVGGRYNNYRKGILSINVNYNEASFFYDDSANVYCETSNFNTCHDTISINSTTYFNVMERLFNDHIQNSDTSVLSPYSVFYNEEGLLQFKMTNNETYSVVK
ncbi:MAG: hypothetical protein ACJAZ3_000638 [Sphingobacteriales bacterium]|jgi:hypothetical protein